MRGLAADLRHAVRVYRKTPLASAVAVLALAAAIGFVGAFLSLWSDLSLKPHPGFAAAGSLVTVGQSDGQRFAPLSLQLVERIRGEAHSLGGIAGVYARPLAIEQDGKREPQQAELVTRGYFSQLRPKLRLGRGFTDADHRERAEPVAVVSYAFWQRRFGGRKDVLGATLRLEGSASVFSIKPGGEKALGEHTLDYRIVGVMAPSMSGTFSTDTDVWIPYEQAGPVFVGESPLYRNVALVSGVGRLRPGADARAVGAELDGRFADAGPKLGLRPGYRFEATPGVVAAIAAHRDAQRQVRLFLAGALLLAVVATCNVSLFLLSRAPGRRRELGIRAAVGAPFRRLARQLATEGAALVAAATVLGLVLGVWLAVFLRGLSLLDGVKWRSASPLDWRVLAMLAGLALLLTASISAAPIVGLRRGGVGASARAMSARAGWGQRLAGTAQLAVAAALAAAAVTFGWYLLALTTADPGFRAAGVEVVRLKVSPSPAVFKDQAALRLERERRREIVGALPGVAAVTLSTGIPGERAGMSGRVRKPGSKPGSAAADEFAEPQLVDADYAYADVLGMRVLQGRQLGPDDGDDVVLVNEALAREYFGRSDVVGEHLEGPGPKGMQSREIVGVVPDVAYGHPSAKMRPTIYSTAVWPFYSMLVRTPMSPAVLRGALQKKIDEKALDVSIRSVEPLARIWSRVLAPDRARALLTGLAASFVVLLSAFGFYGTQRYLVTAGRREYALRAAVGAGPKALGRLVLARGLRLALPGLLLGGPSALVVAGWLRGDFVSAAVSARLVALIVVCALVVLVLSASVGPAHQARRTRPAPALREE